MQEFFDKFVITKGCYGSDLCDVISAERLLKKGQ